LKVAPGFIDNHVHVLGGGGGLGFASRAPELQTSQLTRAGITTVIGMLGFDATSKDMRALVAKTKAVVEGRLAARSPARQPLAYGALADAEIGGDLDCWLLLLEHATDHQESTVRRRTRILVQVHPGLRLGR
jgi:dihydroorotase-like cyclic amidohydrolase